MNWQHTAHVKISVDKYIFLKSISIKSNDFSVKNKPKVKGTILTYIRQIIPRVNKSYIIY